LKTLVVGYNHTWKDKRVMRTVETFSKLGHVYYQFSGGIDLSAAQHNSDIQNFSLCRDEMPGTNKVIKRIRLDREILRLVEELDYDLAYFHSFPASQPVKIFREVKKRGKKLLYDLHEIMPEQFLPERLSFLNPVLWKVLKNQLSSADGVIGVSEEALRMIFEKTGIEKPNLCLPNYATSGVSLENCVKNAEITVVGLTNRNFCINDRVLKTLKKDFRIVSIGAPCDFADEELPFMEYKSMMERLSKAKFTLLAHHSRSDLNFANDIYSLPNKFFDSLAAGTPVILAKRFISMKRIVEETNTGIVLNLIEDPDEDLRKLQNALDHYDEYIENLKIHKHEFVWDESKEAVFKDFVLSIMKS